MKVMKDLSPNQLLLSGLLSNRSDSTLRSQQGHHLPEQMPRTPTKGNAFPNRSCRSVEDMKSPRRFVSKKASSLPHKMQCKGKFQYETPPSRLDSNRRYDNTEDVNLQENFSGYKNLTSPVNKPLWKRRRRFRVRLIYNADAQQEVDDEKAVNVQNIQLTGENRSPLRKEEVAHYTAILNSVIQETINQIKKKCLNNAQKISSQESKDSGLQDDTNLADISEQLNQITGKVVARYACPKTKLKTNKLSTQFKPKMSSQSAQTSAPVRRMRDSVTQFNVSCKNVKVSNQGAFDEDEAEAIPKYNEFPISSDPKIALSDFVIRSKDPRHSEFLISSTKKVPQSDPGKPRKGLAGHLHEIPESTTVINTVVSSNLTQSLSKVPQSPWKRNFQDYDRKESFDGEDEIKAIPKVTPFSQSGEASSSTKENVADYDTDYDPFGDEGSDDFYLYNRHLDLLDGTVQKQIRQIHEIYELYKNEKKYMKRKGLKSIVYNANDMKAVQKILVRICLIMNQKEPGLYDLLEIKGEVISRAADSMLDWIEYMMRISYSKLRYIDRTSLFNPTYSLHQIESSIAKACILIDSMKYCLIGGRMEREEHTSEKVKIREGLRISSQTRYGSSSEQSDSDLETTFDECNRHVGHTLGSANHKQDLPSKAHKPKPGTLSSREKNMAKKTHSDRESNCICEYVKIWENEFPCLDIRESENEFSILNEFGDNEVIFADRKNLLSYYNIGVGNDSSFEEPSRNAESNYFTREVEDLNDELNDALSDERYEVQFRKPTKEAHFNRRKEEDVNFLESDADIMKKKVSFSAKSEEGDLTYVALDTVLDDDTREMQIEQKKMARDEQSEDEYFNNALSDETAKKPKKTKNSKKACVESALNILAEVDERLAVLKTQQKPEKSLKDTKEKERSNVKVFQRPPEKGKKGRFFDGPPEKGMKARDFQSLPMRSAHGHGSDLKGHMKTQSDFQRPPQKAYKNQRSLSERKGHESHMLSHIRNDSDDFRRSSETNYKRHKSLIVCPSDSVRRNSHLKNHMRPLRTQENYKKVFQNPVKKAGLQKQTREGGVQSPNYNLNVMAEFQSDSDNEVKDTSMSPISTENSSMDIEVKAEKAKQKRNDVPDFCNLEDQKDSRRYNQEDRKGGNIYDREDQEDYDMYDQEDKKGYDIYDQNQKDSKAFKRIVGRGRGQRMEAMIHSKAPKPPAVALAADRSLNGRVTEPTITYLQKMGPKEEVKQNIGAGARDFRNECDD